MSIPSCQSLYLPVLKAFALRKFTAGGLVAFLADDLGLTQEERMQLVPSGRKTVFANRVGWAKTVEVRWVGKTSHTGNFSDG